MSDKLDELTPRRQQIVRLVKDGKADKEIAAALGISDTTVGNLIRRMCKESGVSGRWALVGVYFEVRERVSSTK